MFTTADRDRVRRALVERAEADGRVVAAAEVGSLAVGGGDRWSDLDLTFAVADDARVDDVVREWTDALAVECRAHRLFDVRVGATVYRVYLFPGDLQVDLSWTPRAIPQRGEKFRLLFGTATERVEPQAADPRERFGLGVHHALRARFAIERGRVWSAAFYVNQLRDEAFALACIARGLPAGHSRGFDALPRELLERAEASLVRTIHRDELSRALDAAIELLLAEGHEYVASAPDLERELRALIARDV